MPIVKKDDANDGEAARIALYERQIKLLKTFLEHGAISEEQYRKSCQDLTEKMFSKGVQLC